jgi:quinone-modifying oxidoreductase subunit QmoB
MALNENRVEDARPEVFKVVPDVLVIGGGNTGIITALAVAANQPVTIVDDGDTLGSMADALKGNSRVKVWTGTKVISLDGLMGEFVVRFESGGKKWKEKFGGIVVAREAKAVYKSERWGIPEGNQVLTVSGLLDAVKEGSKFYNVAIAVDEDEESLEPTGKALEAAVAIAKAGGNVSLFFQDMKVSADNLEQLYTKARELGVRFMKYVEKPKFSAGSPGITISYKDPFIGLEAKLVADVLAVSEAYEPAPGTEELAEILWVSLAPDGFFQADNIHLLPVKSNREGIYFVGSCHGPIYGVEVYREAQAAAGELAKLAAGRVTVSGLYAQIESDKCALCLTCYRSCPHRAIYVEHSPDINNIYKGAAKVHGLSCRLCGNCASECPAKAIQLPNYTDEQVIEKLSAQPKVVAYACENSAYIASELARELNLDLPDAVEIVKVPCSGKMDIIHILKALEKGAKGVMLLVCHPESCKYVWGNVRAEKRLAQTRKLLEEVGIASDRVELFHLGANMGNQFPDAVTSMVERLK